MAAVFTISATTLAARLQVVPRWLALFGYASAAVLLLGIGLVPWVELAFPIWVFALSVHVLVVQFRDGAIPSDPLSGLRVGPHELEHRERIGAGAAE